MKTQAVLSNGQTFEINYECHHWVNKAVVCSSCGELWLRIVTGSKEWRGWNGNCERCPPWPLHDSVPGAILTHIDLSLNSWNPLFYKAAPRALLVREFLLTFAHWERSKCV